MNGRDPGLKFSSRHYHRLSQPSANIRPRDARAILLDLTGSDDEDIADAADEALAMTGGGFDQDCVDGWDEMDPDDEFLY